MAKNNKKPAPQQPISLKTYIIQNARKLELFRCWELSFEDNGMKQIVVARQKKNGTLLVGMYLVDYLCLGLKDTFYREFEDLEELEEGVFDRAKNEDLNYVETDANYAFNFVYGAIEFAEDLGLEPHRDFKITEYILDDVDDIDYIELEFGKNGRAYFMPGPDDNVPMILAKLDRHVGKGNYDFGMFSSFEEDEDDEDYEMDEITRKISEIQNEDLTEEEFEERIAAQQAKYTDKESAFFGMLLIATLYINNEFDLDELEERYAIEGEPVIEEIKEHIDAKMSPAISEQMSILLITIAFENLIFHEGPEFLLLDELIEAIDNFLNPGEDNFSPYTLELILPFDMKRTIISHAICNDIAKKIFPEDDGFPMLNPFQKKRVINIFVDLMNTYDDIGEVEEEWEDLEPAIDKLTLIEMYIPKLTKEDLTDNLLNFDKIMMPDL